MLGAARDLARPPRPAAARADARPPRARERPRLGRLLGLARLLLALTAASSRRGLRAARVSSPIAATRSLGRRPLPSPLFEIGNSLREARLRQRARRSPRPSRDEDPRQVPARARGRALRAAAVAHVRQGLPALVRRLPRPRRAALRRRVQLALRRRRGRGAAPRARRVPAAQARAARPARVEHRPPRAGRDRGRHGARDRRLALRRRGRAEPCAGCSRHRRRRPHAGADAGRDGARSSCAPTRGDSYLIVEVRRGAPAGSCLPGHARARPDAALHGQGALAPRRATPQNVLVKLNGKRVKLAPAVKAQGVFVTAKKIFPADASLTSSTAPARGDRRHGQRARARRAHRPERPVPRASLLALGLEPARITIVGDDPASSRRRSREAVARRPISRLLGRPRADARRPHRRARGAGRRAPARRRRGARAQIEDVSRLVAERLRRPYADFAAGVRKQATLPDGRDVARARRHGARARARGGRDAGRRAAGPAARAAAALAERARDRAGARACSTAARRRCGACCASSASASRRSRRRSRRRAATATGWRRRSAPATSRSTSTSSSSPGAEERGGAARGGAAAAARRGTSLDGRAVGRGARARACRERGLTLATAESCTGGLVAARLTRCPG